MGPFSTASSAVLHIDSIDIDQPATGWNRNSIAILTTALVYASGVYAPSLQVLKCKWLLGRCTAACSER